MNKTKKLTLGAMLLAIIGALMLIDRWLSFVFEDLIIMAAPVVITIYSCMYTKKDGAILSFGLLVLTILFGSTTAYISMPIAIVVGIGMSFGIKKNYDRRRLTAIAIIMFVIGEVIATFIIWPILGLDVASQITELSSLFEESGLSEGLSMIASDPSSFLLILYVCSTILVGILEGFLISLVTAILLKRLKIKDIGYSNILDLKLSPILAYVLFILTAVSVINPAIFKNINENFYYILLCISLVASLVLVYYGYIFMVIAGRFLLGKKAIIFIVLFVFLLFPLSYIIMVICGFLYGAGPLRDYIERLVERSKEISKNRDDNNHDLNNL